jgi:hypothetical protein
MAAEQLTILGQNSLLLDAAYSKTGISASQSRISSNRDFEGVVLREGDELRRPNLAGAEGSSITIARMRSAEMVQSSGKKVRELSRLWRYMGGECPLD